MEILDDSIVSTVEGEAVLDETRTRPLKHLSEEQEELSLKGHKSFDAGIEKRSLPIQSLETPDYINEGTNFMFNDDKDVFLDEPSSDCLPTIQGKHKDLKTISADTMRDILSGIYDNAVEHMTIIDCRYPYEFQGGHIKKAVNIFTKDGIEKSTDISDTCADFSLRVLI